jgi:hypothetical protein
MPEANEELARPVVGAGEGRSTPSAPMTVVPNTVGDLELSVDL